MDTKDLVFFTRQELMEPETSLQVLALGERIVRGLNSADAFRLFKALRRILTNWDEPKPGIPSALELQYARLRDLTRVIAIPLLPDEEAIETVKESLVESLHHPEFDLDAYKTIFKRRLLTLPITARDTYKEELRRALHENRQRLTKQYLVVDGKDQLGTVGNWLSDYIKAVGGGEVDTLQRAEYFATRRADEEDRVALKKLIDLYEFLKLSSVTAQGVEETLGAYYPDLGKYFILNEQGFAEEIPEVTAVFNKTAEVETLKAEPVTPSKIEKVVSVEAPATLTVKPALKAPPILPPQISHADHPLRVELEELIDQVVKNVELKMQNVEWLKDTVIKKRFRTMVSARLRDIRDETETREMIKRDRKVGGMGLPPPLTPPRAGGENSDLVMGIIEKAFREFQNKWKAVEDKRRAERKKEQQNESHKQEQLKAEQEQKDLEERYQRLTGVIPKPQVPPVPEQSSVRGFAISKEIPKQKITISKTPPPLPAVISQPVKAVVIPSKPPAPAPLPVPPQPSTTTKARPYTLTPRPSQKITDIRQPAKLVGPIEELQSLTLDDFRKLSGTVKESVNKILVKIEFIGQESLGRRLAAIAAWKKSPLYGLYNKLMSDSLSNKVSPEDLARGDSTLTRDEFYAIMELNQKLRF